MELRRERPRQREIAANRSETIALAALLEMLILVVGRLYLGRLSP